MRRMIVSILGGAIAGITLGARAETVYPPKVALDLRPGGMPLVFSYRGEYMYSPWGDEDLAAYFGKLDGASMKLVSGDEMERTKQQDVERYLTILSGVKKKKPGFTVLEHLLLDSHVAPGLMDPPEAKTIFSDFFPGHYLYCIGTTLERALSATATDIPIAAADHGKFQPNDFVRLIAPGDLSDPKRWRESEAVRVAAINDNSLAVERGFMLTKPRAFPAGSRALPHKKSHWPNPRLVVYNMSRFSLPDEKGRRCPGALADIAAEWFAAANAKHGKTIDGFEFDVLTHHLGRGMHIITIEQERASRRAGQGPPRETKPVLRDIDMDFDGTIDNMYPDNQPAWGIGILDFLRALRKKLGPGPILIGDVLDNLSRGIPYTSGVMNEDFPDIGSVSSFSAAFQRIEDYLARVNPAHRPMIFNVNKFEKRTGAGRFAAFPTAGDKLRFQTAANLIMGAGQAGFGDISLMQETDFTKGVFDEYVGGKLGRWHYLGKPVAPYRRLFERGNPVWRWDPGGEIRLENKNGAYAVTADVSDGWCAVTVDRYPREGTPFDPETDCALVLNGPAVEKGRDYTLSFAACAKSIYDSIPDPHAGIPLGFKMGFDIGGKKATRTSAGYFAFAERRTLSVSYLAAESGQARITFYPGWEPGTLYIGPMYLYEGSCDRFVREFEHGAVFLNAGGSPFTCRLADLFGGRKFSHLTATEDSFSPDPKINLGGAAGPEVTVGPYNGLILIEAK